MICNHRLQVINEKRGFCTKCYADAYIDIDGAVAWCAIDEEEIVKED